MPRLEHPYHDLTGGRWLRGNLHAHTTRSDGEHEPQQLVDAYVERGYGFLALTDHDICWTPTNLATLDPRGMVLLPGNEVTMGGPHMCHVGADRRLEPDWRRQNVIDQANEGPGFIVVNHPNWQQHFDHVPFSQLDLLKHYTGVEIFNGIMQHDEGSAYALNKWDMLLSSGRRVWGFANDDTHGQRFVGFGWNTAYVRDTSNADDVEAGRQAVLDALKAGRFYASTGVHITGIHIDGMRVTIETDNARRIVGIGKGGKRFAMANDHAIEIDVPDDVSHARFTCWGEGEQFAWTQPMWVVEDE